MKPEFALSLSFEGISLLYRVDGGWHLLGEAALTSQTLGADLETLREMAVSIGGKDFRTKLVLPNDQIKYLTLATGDISHEARAAAVGDELETTTPYSLDELAFDLDPAGKETRAAAVARETLDEAEAFATEHAFHPVCFVATPPDGDFAREPFFGPTKTAAKLLGQETAEGDAHPIHVISSGPLPEPAPAPEPEPEQEEETPPAPDQAPEEPAAPTDDAPADDAPADEAPLPAFGSRRKTSPDLRAKRDTETTAPRSDTTLTASREDAAALRFDPARIAAGLRPQDTPEDPAPKPSEKEGAAASFQHNRAASPASTPAQERQRMMIFGARSNEVGGKPRYLGLALTVALLLFLAAVAAWAALFTDEGVTGLLRRDPPPQIADSAPESHPTQSLETDALPPVSVETITDSAEIEAMEDLDHPTALDGVEAEARYAATGIWQRAPDQALLPRSGTTDDLYLASIDRVVIAKDAVALPTLASYGTDRPLPRQISPLPQGMTFDLDDRGLVKATPDGAISPEGITVYLGRPPVLPPAYPTRKATPDEALSPEQRTRIAQKRPRLRPGDLIEQNERASNGGRSLAELGRIRPRLRPETAKALEEAEDTTGTQYAVATSLRPKARPANFETIVARAERTAPTQPTTAYATVAPALPSKASVARQATVNNAINLRKVNLIGVYGTSGSRRALVRLSNGRFKKVKVGDRIDGGKVAAIGDTELRYVKSGKNIILKLPRG